MLGNVFLPNFFVFFYSWKLSDVCQEKNNKIYFPSNAACLLITATLIGFDNKQVNNP